MNNLVAYDGQKAVTIWSDEGWSPIGGGPEVEKGTPAYLAQTVAFLYRCAIVSANAVASIPWDLVNAESGDVVDTSIDWKDITGLMPMPELTMKLITYAQGLSGKAYMMKAANSFGVAKRLKWLAPGSVTFELKDDGTVTFKRPVQSQDKEYPPAIAKDDKPAKSGESVVALWLPDPDVEIGPPLKYPGRAALAAAGVTANMDSALAGYFKRGMIKVTAFSVPANTPEREKEKFESSVKNFLTGINNAFRTIFIRADKITPVVMGEGLADMQNNTLTTEKREDMALAFGIPYTIMLSSSAAGLGGGGVTTADRIKLMTDCALPWFRDIAREMNRQIWLPMGYRMVDRHETMDVFQEDERERSYALVNYVNASSTEPELTIAWSEVLGIEIPEEIRKILERFAKEKEQRQREMEQQMMNNPQGQQPGQFGKPKPGEPDIQPKREPAENKAVGIIIADLRKWRTKACKGTLDFESDVIPEYVYDVISDSLKNCQTENDIKAVFSAAISDLVNPNPDRGIDYLKAAIEDGIKALNEQ